MLVRKGSLFATAVLRQFFFMNNIRGEFGGFVGKSLDSLPGLWFRFQIPLDCKMCNKNIKNSSAYRCDSYDARQSRIILLHTRYLCAINIIKYAAINNKISFIKFWSLIPLRRKLIGFFSFLIVSSLIKIIWPKIQSIGVPFNYTFLVLQAHNSCIEA